MKQFDVSPPPLVKPVKKRIESAKPSSPNLIISHEAERLWAARNDPNAFISYCFLDGRPQKRFHAEWQWAYTNEDRIVLFCSLEHGKTEQISIWRTLYELGRNPDLRFLILSAKLDMAQKILSGISELIMGNEMLHRVFPNLVAEDRPRRTQAWSTKQLIIRRDLTSRDPSIQVSGLKGSVIGARIDRLIGDDTMNFKNTMYPTERERSINWFRSSECLGRVTANGKVVLINSPWHELALAHVAVKQMKFKRLETFACDDKLESILWPKEVSMGRVVGFDRERLLQKIDEMGLVEFGRNFQGKTLTSKTQWMDIDAMIACVNDKLRNPNVLPDDMVPMCTIDPAMGKKKSNDTVFFYGGVNIKTGMKRLCYLKAGRLAAIPTVKEMLRLLRIEPRLIFWVEGNAQQEYLLEIIRTREVVQAAGATEAEARTLAARTRPFITTDEKSDPNTGIPAMSADFEGKTWELPHDPVVDEWFRQAMEYRPGNITHTGDIMMAAYIFWSRCQNMIVRRNILPNAVLRHYADGDEHEMSEFSGIRERTF